MLRGLFIAAFFFTMTPLLISVQWVLDRFGLPGWGAIASNYYRVLCKIMRIRVRVVGTPVRDRAVLFVSNHVSWSDILVIGSLAPVAFVAKREVRDWPLVGITAQLQRTVFVDRTRRQQTGDAISEICKRLESGVPVVLFAEGTSSDGNRVLPFRSALIGAVRDACRMSSDKRLVIQPMAICYTGAQGIPMGRQHMPAVAWYGDLDFMPHIKAFIQRAPFDAVVSFGDPITTDGEGDRKEMARMLEGTVRRVMASALRGRSIPAASEPSAGHSIPVEKPLPVLKSQ
ncbi:MAG TPA: lysophospholipid acyltransferase family protein [Pseudolabrys sp.]|jgi:1-acyl-sn-glycerol-3-phosphate acyltransferase|nr:lysophospholipid acyltransferase family protein [Pseudolabrys sp.]